jgi:hypothetical protein
MSKPGGDPTSGISLGESLIDAAAQEAYREARCAKDLRSCNRLRRGTVGTVEGQRTPATNASIPWCVVPML